MSFLINFPCTSSKKAKTEGKNKKKFEHKLASYHILWTNEKNWKTNFSAVICYIGLSASYHLEVIKKVEKKQSAKIPGKSGNRITFQNTKNAIFEKIFENLKYFLKPEVLY